MKIKNKRKESWRLERYEGEYGIYGLRCGNGLGGVTCYFNKINGEWKITYCAIDG